MKRDTFILSLLILMIPLFSSCATVLKSSDTAYEVSADNVKANVDVSYARAYDASLETIRSMGGLSIDKKSEGWVRSELSHYDVAVHIEKLSENTAQITVSAKSYSLPQVQYASDVMIKILKRVKDQPVWLR